MTKSQLRREKNSTQKSSSDGGLIAQRLMNSSLMQKKAKKHNSIFKNSNTIQKKNNTGLPDNLKSGMENLSGMSLDHVKVHYNSSKPTQLNAHAFAQGSDIHVASGQEKHLPHELGHVVQQMQGRVKPTATIQGMALNDNPALESEATQMGQSALQMKSNENAMNKNLNWQVATNYIQMVRFNNRGSLNSHFDKHVTNQGDAGGSYATPQEYDNAVDRITSTGGYDEKKTVGANTYYWKNSTGQFAVVRGGRARTLFVPSAGKRYFDNK